MYLWKPQDCNGGHDEENVGALQWLWQWWGEWRMGKELTAKAGWGRNSQLRQRHWSEVFEKRWGLPRGFPAAPDSAPLWSVGERSTQVQQAQQLLAQNNESITTAWWGQCNTLSFPNQLLLFSVVVFFSTSLFFVRNFSHLTQVRHSSRKSSATHSYRCVQYFCVSKQWYGCQCLGFSTCTQMLMHATAYGGCADTVRESALKADSRRKNPFSILKPRSVLRMAIPSDTLPVEIFPAPPHFSFVI